MSREPLDDFERDMHAIARVEDALRLLLHHFMGEGYSVADVVALVSVSACEAHEIPRYHTGQSEVFTRSHKLCRLAGTLRKI